MADNEKGQGVDHDKVKAEAQKLAGGKAPETSADGDAAKIPAGEGSTTPLTENNAGTATAENKTAATNVAGRVTQGAPGREKPGAADARRSAAATSSAEPLSEEEAEAKVHADLVKHYGRDYVKVQKAAAGGDKVIQTYFSRKAWDLLGPNKEGWKPVVNEPTEVKNLKKKQAEA